jgi:type IV secretory pathway VirB2 component (pilin)
MRINTKAIGTVTTANRLWATVLMATAACLLLTAPAFAAYDSITWVLCGIVNQEIMGNIGRGLATLGILSIAAGAIVGKVSWGTAVTVVIGIGILFGANHIAAVIVGADCSAINNA